MEPIISIFKKKLIFYTIIRIILTIIFISLCPVLLVIYGILSLYRHAIFKIARRVDPTLGRMVSPISNLFAAHDIYGNSLTINVALYVVGKIDKHHLIHGFEKLIENAKNPDGTFQYPELKQRIVTRFGYTFWKNVDNFKVENHVEYLNEAEPGTLVTLGDVRKVIAKFGKTPMDKSRSPWMIYIVKNFRKEGDPSVKSAIILRLHHCLFDAQSATNIFEKLADNGPFVLEGHKKMATEVEAINTRLTKDTLISKALNIILRSLIILICGPYELMGQLTMFDRNELLLKNRREFKEIMRFHETGLIPLEQLKWVKNHFGVAMSTLLSTLTVRSLRQYMAKRGITPNKIHMTFPIQMGSKKDKLRNCFSAGMISFDLGHDNAVQLLQETDKKIRRFKYSYSLGLCHFNSFILKMIGSMPTIFIPRVDNAPLSSTLMNSSVPGPVNMAYFCGFPIVDGTVAGSISKPYPVGMLSFSYRGFYKFGWSGDVSVFPTQEDITELGDLILEELKQFQRITEENHAKMCESAIFPH